MDASDVMQLLTHTAAAGWLISRYLLINNISNLLINACKLPVV